MKKILSLCLLVLVLAAVIAFYRLELLPIKNIQIDGELQHADIEAVQNVIMPFLQQGLLRIDIGEMQNTLMTLPWIAQARVSRTWPDTVHIWLKEPKAVALWADTGIVSETGQVFYLPREIRLPADLPVFEGLEGQVPLMLEQYRKMQAILQPLNLEITRIILTPRFAWEVELNNGIWLRLGQQETLQRVQRFASAYPDLINNHARIEYIDLRYPNGLAIKPNQEISSFYNH